MYLVTTHWPILWSKEGHIAQGRIGSSCCFRCSQRHRLDGCHVGRQTDPDGRRSTVSGHCAMEGDISRENGAMCFMLWGTANYWNKRWGTEGERGRGKNCLLERRREKDKLKGQLYRGPAASISAKKCAKFSLGPLAKKVSCFESESQVVAPHAQPWCQNKYTCTHVDVIISRGCL